MLSQALASHRELAFHNCKLRALKYKVISEFFRNSFEQKCDLDVIIDQSSTRLFDLTNQAQPTNKPVTEISSLREGGSSIARSSKPTCRVAVSGQHSLYKSRHISIRFVSLGSVGYNSVRAVATTLATTFSRGSSEHNLSSHVRRLFQEPLSVAGQS